MEDIQEKYNHLLQQNEALRQENEELTYTIKSFQSKGDILVYGNPSS